MTRYLNVQIEHPKGILELPIPDYVIGVIALCNPTCNDELKAFTCVCGPLSILHHHKSFLCAVVHCATLDMTIQVAS